MVKSFIEDIMDGKCNYAGWMADFRGDGIICFQCNFSWHQTRVLESLGGLQSTLLNDTRVNSWFIKSDLKIYKFSPSQLTSIPILQSTKILFKSNLPKSIGFPKKNFNKFKSTKSKNYCPLESSDSTANKRNEKVSFWYNNSPMGFVDKYFSINYILMKIPLVIRQSRLWQGNKKRKKRRKWYSNTIKFNFLRIFSFFLVDFM